MLSLLVTRKLFSKTHLLPLLTAKPFASIPKTTSNFMVDYLISSFGFSPDKAAKAAKLIAHIKSPQNPDSVRHFLKHHGFTDSQIKTIITWRPQILSYSPENTLEPNLRALRGMGLSNSAVTQIVLSDPRGLLVQTAVPRLKFCRDFLGGSEAALVRACKANRTLASHDIGPKIHLLHSLGLSTQDIRSILLTFALMEDLLNRTKELGFPPGSPMFVCGLKAVSWNSREALQKKMELFESYGWFKDDFFAPLRKSPNVACLTKRNLRTKMDFLVGEARCDLSYIASNPVLLSFSLEKRLRPRHHVLQLFESKGLSSTKHDFTYSMKMSDKKFVETYIQSHKEELPGVHENFLAALRANSDGLDS